MTRVKNLIVGNPQNCSICHEDIGRVWNICNINCVVHRFHNDCILKYSMLESTSKTKEYLFCPICLRSLQVADVAGKLKIFTWNSKTIVSFFFRTAEKTPHLIFHAFPHILLKIFEQKVYEILPALLKIRYVEHYRELSLDRKKIWLSYRLFFMEQVAKQLIIAESDHRVLYAYAKAYGKYIARSQTKKLMQKCYRNIPVNPTKCLYLRQNWDLFNWLLLCVDLPRNLHCTLKKNVLIPLSIYKNDYAGFIENLSASGCCIDNHMIMAIKCAIKEHKLLFLELALNCYTKYWIPGRYLVYIFCLKWIRKASFPESKAIVHKWLIKKPHYVSVKEIFHLYNIEYDP